MAWNWFASPRFRNQMKSSWWRLRLCKPSSWMISRWSLKKFHGNTSSPCGPIWRTAETIMVSYLFWARFLWRCANFWPQFCFVVMHNIRRIHSTSGRLAEHHSSGRLPERVASGASALAQAADQHTSCQSAIARRRNGANEICSWKFANRIESNRMKHYLEGFQDEFWIVILCMKRFHSEVLSDIICIVDCVLFTFPLTRCRRTRAWRWCTFWPRQ